MAQPLDLGDFHRGGPLKKRIWGRVLQIRNQGLWPLGKRRWTNFHVECAYNSDLRQDYIARTRRLEPLWRLEARTRGNRAAEFRMAMPGPLA
jgi:hypothetical protein